MLEITMTTDLLDQYNLFSKLYIFKAKSIKITSRKKILLAEMRLSRQLTATASYHDIHLSIKVTIY